MSREEFILNTTNELEIMVRHYENSEEFNDSAKLNSKIFRPGKRFISRYIEMNSCYLDENFIQQVQNNLDEIENYIYRIC